MRMLSIAITNVKGILRDIRSSGTVFILPIVFMGIFGIVFGSSFSDITLRLGYISADNNQYSEFIDVLESLEKEDGESLFRVREYQTEEELRESVISGTNYIGLLPSQSESGEGRIILVEDNANALSTAAASVVRDVTNPNRELFESETVARDVTTGFQLQAPGLIVYGILIMMPITTWNLAQLRDKNYIFRYFTSKTKAWEILGGFVISQSILTFIQTIILFVTAQVFGFDASGNLLPAFLFAFMVNFFTIGAGLLIGSFVTKGEAGQNISNVFSIILGFLSGSFIVGIENVELFDTGITITDIIPTYYATKGIREILLFDQPLSSVLEELFIIGAVGLILLVLGIIVYQQRQLKKLY